jgi:hypothetical protein
LRQQANPCLSFCPDRVSSAPFRLSKLTNQQTLSQMRKILVVFGFDLTNFGIRSIRGEQFPGVEAVFFRIA